MQGGGSAVSEEKSIVSYHVGEYGKVTIKLARLLDSRNISRYRLGKLTGIDYPIINRYYKAQNVSWVDLDFLAKVCYALNCRIEDILEYEKPEEILNDLQNTLED